MFVQYIYNHEVLTLDHVHKRSIWDATIIISVYSRLSSVVAVTVPLGDVPATLVELTYILYRVPPLNGAIVCSVFCIVIAPLSLSSMLGHLLWLHITVYLVTADRLGTLHEIKMEFEVVEIEVTLIIGLPRSGTLQSQANGESIILVHVCAF